ASPNPRRDAAAKRLRPRLVGWPCRRCPTAGGRRRLEDTACCETGSPCPSPNARATAAAPPHADESPLLYACRSEDLTADGYQGLSSDRHGRVRLSPPRS